MKGKLFYRVAKERENMFEISKIYFFLGYFQKRCCNFFKKLFSNYELEEKKAEWIKTDLGNLNFFLASVSSLAVVALWTRGLDVDEAVLAEDGAVVSRSPLLLLSSKLLLSTIPIRLLRPCRYSPLPPNTERTERKAPRVRPIKPPRSPAGIAVVTSTIVSDRCNKWQQWLPLPTPCKPTIEFLQL